MNESMPDDLLERFNFLRKKAKERYDKAETRNEKIEVEREIESLETVFKAYYYSYDMMKALS